MDKKNNRRDLRRPPKPPASKDAKKQSLKPNEDKPGPSNADNNKLPTSAISNISKSPEKPNPISDVKSNSPKSPKSPDPNKISESPTYSVEKKKKKKEKKPKRNKNKSPKDDSLLKKKTPPEVKQSPPPDPTKKYYNIEKLKKEAPRSLGRRMKELREFERENPDAKLNDNLVEEYLFHELKDEATEIAIDDSGAKTETEIEARRKKIADRKVRRAYRFGKHKDEDKNVIVEETVPYLPPSPSKLHGKEKHHNATGKPQNQHHHQQTSSPKAKEKPSTPPPPPEKSPLSKSDREKQMAEAQKKLLQLIKDRREMGPDREMLKSNKVLEQAVIEEAFAKKTLIEIANKKDAEKRQKEHDDRMHEYSKEYEGNKDVHKEKEEKRRSYLKPRKDSDGKLILDNRNEEHKTRRPSGSNDDHLKSKKSPEKGNKSSKDDDDDDDNYDFLKGLELEELQMMIEKEENLLKSGGQKDDENSSDEEEEGGGQVSQKASHTNDKQKKTTGENVNEVPKSESESSMEGDSKKHKDKDTNKNKSDENEDETNVKRKSGEESKRKSFLSDQDAKRLSILSGKYTKRKSAHEDDDATLSKKRSSAENDKGKKSKQLDESELFKKIRGEQQPPEEEEEKEKKEKDDHKDEKNKKHDEKGQNKDRKKSAKDHKGNPYAPKKGSTSSQNKKKDSTNHGYPHKDAKKDQKSDGKATTKDHKENTKENKKDSSHHSTDNKKDHIKKDATEETEEKDDKNEEGSKVAPPVEYQEVVYGNVRFLDLKAIKPLQALKDDANYNEMFGMIKNPKWVKIHFTMTDEDREALNAKRKRHEERKKHDPEAEKKQRKQERKEKKEKKAKKKERQKEKEKVEPEPDFEVKLSQSYLDLMKDKAGVTDLKVVSRIPRSHMFARPAREVYYVEIPTVDKDYQADWTKVGKDTLKKSHKTNQLPEFLTSSSDPVVMMDMLIHRMELNGLAAKAQLWTGKPAAPRNDYFDWMMSGTHPLSHSGGDLLVEEKEDERYTDRQAEKSGKRTWFRSPPHIKPPDSPPESPFDQFHFCHYGDRAKAYFIDSTVPRSIYLYNDIYRKNGLFNEVKKPDGSFPGFALPRWLYWSLDQKLPQHPNLPPGSFYWSRGYLGDPARPKLNNGSFRMDDPFDINGQEYNALHDEHCVGYLQRPVVRDHLYRANLTNLQGYVLCTQKEQNQYRLYLRDAVYREECEKLVKSKINRKIYQLAAYRHVKQQEGDFADKQALWEETIEFGNELKEKKQQERLEKQEKAELEWKKRLEKLEKAKEAKVQEQRYKKVMLYPRPSYEMEGRILEALKIEKEIYNELKQERAAENRAVYHMQQIANADEKKRMRWQNKVLAMNRTEATKKWASEVARDERKHRIAKREEHVIATRNRQPEIMLQRKLKALWLKGIVRKYAMRWLEITRRRKKERQDVKHNSQWNPTSLLDKTVEFLRQESGYKTFDNLVLNLFGGDQLKNLMRGPEHHSNLRSEPGSQQSQSASNVDSKAPTLMSNASETKNDDSLDNKEIPVEEVEEVVETEPEHEAVQIPDDEDVEDYPEYDYDDDFDDDIDTEDDDQ